MLKATAVSPGVIYADSPNKDAFDRLRVSPPYTVFDSKQLINNQPLFWDDQQVSGAGTASTYLGNFAATRLDVTGNIAGQRVRQTFRRFQYQPGKSQLILITLVLTAEGGAGITGVTSRVGPFDEDNGFFLQRTAGALAFGVRTSTSGAPVDTIIPQASWNLDRMDGTGPSRITLDPTKTQIFVLDFQWLGVGRVRLGFNIGGVTYYCHQVFNANVLAVPYMQTPNLPLRFELTSAGTGPANTASLLHICTSVQSEGGQQNTGLVLAADRDATVLQTTNDTNIYSLLALRYQAAKANKFATISNIQYSVMTNSTNTTFRMGLYLNPTIAGAALAFTAVPNSALEVALPVAANLITAGSGTLMASYYDSQNHSSGLLPQVPSDLRIGANIAGTSDILVLFVQPVPAQGNTNFYGSFNWLEQV
jgi:hypothetical protein